MFELERRRNCFISFDNFIVEQVRKKVIQENGQLVVPVLGRLAPRLP